MQDTKSGAGGEEAAAQPPRTAGRQAIDATRAAATKLLGRQISASGWARVGSLCILQSPLPLPPVPTRRLPCFPSSTLLGLAVPTVCPRPSRRLPRLDFVATTGRGRAPNKGTWFPEASPRKVLLGGWRDGDRLLWSG